MKAMPPTTNIADDEAPALEHLPLERLESQITKLPAHLNAATSGAACNGTTTTTAVRT